MLIKLTGRNKELILINKNNLAACYKHGNGQNGVNSKVILCNIDRSQSDVLLEETVEQVAFKSSFLYRIINLFKR